MTTPDVAFDGSRCHILHVHTYVLIALSLLFRDASIEIPQDGIHETGELSGAHLSSEVDAGEALRNVKTPLGTRDGDIELSGIFGNAIGIVAIEITGVAVVNGIKDNDIVELQPFRLVYGGDEDAVVEVRTVAEVGLLERVEFEDVATQLAGK